MKKHTDVNTKSGVTLDFIVYAVVSNSPTNVHGIGGFFFQDHRVVNKVENYCSDEDIINNIAKYYPDITDENERKLIRYSLEDMFTFHWKALFHERQGCADIIKDYFEYLDHFIDVDEIISENFDYVDFDEVNTLLDLYTTEEIEDILFEVNYFISENSFYDNENQQGDLLEEENYTIKLAYLKEDFEDFLSLRYIFPNTYISYYASQIFFLEQKTSNKMRRFVREIDALTNSPTINQVSTSSKYLETLISENEILCYKHSFDTPQLDGFFEEVTPVVTLYDTLWNYLNILKDSSIFQFTYLNNIYQYNYLELDDEHCLYGMKLKYLNFKLYGENEDSDEESLSENFTYFIKEKENFIQYLKRKNFTTREINIILNILSENKYNSLDIKSLNTERDIYFFRICYFFHVFDYFTEIEGIIFDSIVSFQPIIKFNSQNKRENKQQFLKNYSNINNPEHKDYPFTLKKTELFLSEIEYSLGIDREKLKPIPELKVY
ncbi:hypothetical protein QX233_20715 [Chryseobacterium gambrini]|uniref:Uncharacterized protein n=1 Tax=Chryseobacterium gambrini TaxID=373672 RepID=A0AAJ1VM62_9FLAO|nr:MULTISPECIES: hypothetical protein [Chryseobacterium]MDN4014896.1 hypothetical protein [Chryseobacterium gambrini]QWA39569.1 hypothetical protein KKI44_05005 [Chryseobacterium sp. ZHDP1]